MKILFILENHYPKIGGVETLFKNLTDSLAKEGHQVTVLTNRGTGENLHPRESYMDNLTIIRKPFLNRYIFTFLAWIPGFLLARKHDIIHTTSYNAGIPAYISGLLARKKVLITFHEVWGKMWFDLPFFSKFSLSLHYWFEKVLLKFPFHRFIAVSNFTAQQLEKNGIVKSRISMIYNGLEYSEFKIEKSARDNEFFTFLYFGRLGISKGLDILINGAAICDKPFKLQLVLPTYPADLLKIVKDLVLENGLDEKVEFFHELPFETLKEKITHADAVIVPSYSEGFCFTAVETIALGTPIISSDNGALKEVVSGKHLKMESFTSEALKEKMELAIDGEFLESEVRRFHLSDSIESYKKLYSEILTKRD